MAKLVRSRSPSSDRQSEVSDAPDSPTSEKPGTPPLLFDSPKDPLRECLPRTYGKDSRVNQAIHFENRFSQLHKKPRRIPLVMTQEQEEEVVEFVRSHGSLYNKGLRQYKDTVAKARLWQEKADEMKLGVSGGELRRWYESMRTRFGRLTLAKSGQEEKEHTERDSWILSQFSFLGKHIVRVESRQGVSRKAKMAQALRDAGLTAHPREEEEDEDEDQGAESDDLTDNQSEAASSAAGSTTDLRTRSSSTGHRRNGKRKALETPTSSKVTAQMAGVESRCGEASSSIQQQLYQQQTDRTAWGTWLMSCVDQIHPQLWPVFRRYTFETFEYFIKESERLRQTDPPPSNPLRDPGLTSPRTLYDRYYRQSQQQQSAPPTNKPQHHPPLHPSNQQPPSTPTILPHFEPPTPWEIQSIITKSEPSLCE